MADTEKITINMGVVDLGKIDLLVNNGFYSNRTDFIRTAIRNQISNHGEEVKDITERQQYVVGAIVWDAKDLEEVLERNEVLDIKVVGLLSLADDVTPELALKAIKSIKVSGIFRAPKNVKKALISKSVGIVSKS